MENIAKNCNDELTLMNKTQKSKIWLKFLAEFGHLYLPWKSNSKFDCRDFRASSSNSILLTG